MPLVAIVPDVLWHAQWPLKFGPLSLTTRMTVVRLRDGSLWVHSPILPTKDIVDELCKLGRVGYVVAPNKSHHLFFADFMAVFPDAAGFIAEGVELKRPDLARFPRIPRSAPWEPEIEGFFIEGLPIINETAWFHRDTGSLILADLLFCFSSSNTGIAALISKLLGVHGRLGMSRTMKLATKDRQALQKTVTPLLSLPIKRVIVAHDQIVDEEPAQKIEQAFSWLR